MDKEKRKLTPAMQKLVDAMEEKNVKVVFGLEKQGHLPTIERHLSRFELAEFSPHIWNDIGREIGWDPLTAALRYFQYYKQ